MFANSKKVTTFAPAIEREILDKKDGPFVYRLGRKIFILERGVRFPHGLPKERIHYKCVLFLHISSFQLLFLAQKGRIVFLSLKLSD